MSGGLRGAFAGGMSIFVAAAALVGIGSSSAQGAAFGTQFPVSGPVVDDRSGAYEGAVAAGDDGEFAYAWVQQESDDRYAIETRTISSNGVAGPLHVIASADGSGSVSDQFTSVDLSTDPDGGFHLAWTRTTYTCSPVCVSSFRIQYANLDETGAPVGVTSDVYTSDPSRSAVGPVVATSGTGRTGILFGVFDGLGSTDVLMAIAEDNGVPLAPFELSGDNWDGVQHIDIAASSNGTLFPVWSGYHGPDIAAHGRFVTDGGTITAERELMTGASSLDDVEARIDGNGRGTVFALDFSGNSLLEYRQMAPDGTLVGSGPVRASLNDATDATVGHPFSAVAADGTVLFTFAQRSSGDGRRTVWTRAISNTGVLANPKAFDPPAPDAEPSLPSLAVGRKGDGFVTWSVAPESPPDDAFYLYMGGPVAADGSPTGAKRVIRTLARVPEEYPSPVDAAYSADGNGAVLWSEAYEAFDYRRQLRSAIFDGSAPSARLWVPTTASLAQDVVLAVEASDNSDLAYSWKVDGETLSSSGAAIRHTFGRAGTTRIEVTVTDLAGNATVVSGTTRVSGAKAPPMPPDTRITAKPGKRTKSKTATFKFASSLAGSTFECKLGRAGWADCGSPKRYKRLGPGRHVFKVRAIKGDLIDKSPASYAWTVKPKKKRR